MEIENPKDRIPEQPVHDQTAIELLKILAHITSHYPVLKEALDLLTEFDYKELANSLRVEGLTEGTAQSLINKLQPPILDSRK